MSLNDDLQCVYMTMNDLSTSHHVSAIILLPITWKDVYPPILNLILRVRMRHYQAQL